MRITGWSVLLALGIFAGADGRAAAQAVNTEASIVYYDMAGNATLDPAEPQNNSTYSHEALLAIYDTLIRLDDAGVPGPGLADSWTRNDDLTELTLHIRPGVMFHDGTPVNAEAVMDALHLVCRTRNIPVIVNLHGLDIARRYCDRVVAMSRGRVVFDDVPQRLTKEALVEIYGGSGKWSRDAAYAMEPAA